MAMRVRNCRLHAPAGVLRVNSSSSSLSSSSTCGIGLDLPELFFLRDFGGATGRVRPFSGCLPPLAMALDGGRHALRLGACARADEISCAKRDAQGFGSIALSRGLFTAAG